MIGTLRLLLRENGWRWTGLFALVQGVRRLHPDWSEPFQVRLADFERRHDLQGINSRTLNRHLWDHWDWARGGEEWTPSQAWKDSLVTYLLIPHIPEGGAILEIGPGGGRWTEHLLPRAERLIAVDISTACVEQCRQRFGDRPQAEFRINDGQSLPGVADASVDTVWSFDVFVHIAPEDTGRYLLEIARVLRPGGRGIIHHPAVGGDRGGFRSATTRGSFERQLADAGLRVVDQLDQWGPETHHGVRHFGDVVTIFEKPPPA